MRIWHIHTAAHYISANAHASKCFHEIRKLKKCQRLPEQILDANEQEQPLKPKIFFGIIMDVGAMNT